MTDPLDLIPSLAEFEKRLRASEAVKRPDPIFEPSFPHGARAAEPAASDFEPIEAAAKIDAKPLKAAAGGGEAAPLKASSGALALVSPSREYPYEVAETADGKLADEPATGESPYYRDIGSRRPVEGLWRYGVVAALLVGLLGLTGALASWVARGPQLASGPGGDILALPASPAPASSVPEAVAARADEAPKSAVAATAAKADQPAAAAAAAKADQPAVPSAPNAVVRTVSISPEGALSGGAPPPVEPVRATAPTATAPTASERQLPQPVSAAPPAPPPATAAQQQPPTDMTATAKPKKPPHRHVAKSKIDKLTGPKTASTTTVQARSEPPHIPQGNGVLQTAGRAFGSLGRSIRSLFGNYSPDGSQR